MVNKTCIIVIGVLTFVTVLAVTVTLGILYWPVNLQREFMSRCAKYPEKHPEVLLSQMDCEMFWALFTQAFVGKDPSDVAREAYNPLIQAVPKKPTCDRRMFWSGIKKPVHEYAKKCSHVPQEFTLPAFLLDDLTWWYNGKDIKWCGKKGSQEIFTRGCPDGPFRSFWDQSSAAFAASSCGHAFVMLDGSRVNPFYPESTFARVETKNFNFFQLKSLTVWLVTKEGDTKTCGNDESLKILENRLKNKITYRCEVVKQSQLQTCHY